MARVGSWRTKVTESVRAACQSSHTVLPITRTIPRWAAWALVLVTWGAGFGLSTVKAVQQLISGQTKSDVGDTAWWIVGQLVTSKVAVTALLVCCALVVMLWASSGNVFRWQGWRAELRAGGVTLAGFWLCSLLMMAFNSLLGRGDTSYLLPDSSPRNTLFMMTLAGTAGFIEEPLFTVLIPVALRAGGYRWRTVILVSAALRVAFHLYYGPSALMLAAWAALAVLVVARTGCLWGIIILHSSWDLSSFGLRMLPGAWAVIFGLALVAVMVLMFWAVVSAASALGADTPRPGSCEGPTQGTEGSVISGGNK